jgi:hypothetical protein
MTKDDVLNFRVPADLKAALRRAAEQDDRSMGGMAGKILREWLMEKGFLSIEASRPVPRRRRS